MFYVYELSYDGIVFYVGYTHQPYRRYLSHSSFNGSTTRHAAYIIYKLNEFIEFKIIYHSPVKLEVTIMEYKTICSYISKGVNLCNGEYNPYSNRMHLPNFNNEINNNKHQRRNAKHVKEYINNYISSI